jgi:hypothetical protein
VTIPDVPVCQVTLVVTSIVWPPAVAVAVKQSFPVAVVLSGKLKLVIPLGPSVMLVTLANVIVAVVVALAVPDAAVMVVVPAETPVKRPPVLMVATLGVELDQHTVFPVQLVPPVSVTAFPSLSVPAAVSCWVNPMLTAGFGGSIVMLVMVGFTKNPLQLTASAIIPSTANAPITRRFHFIPSFSFRASHRPRFKSKSVFCMILEKL